MLSGRNAETISVSEGQSSEDADRLTAWVDVLVAPGSGKAVWIQAGGNAGRPQLAVVIPRDLHFPTPVRLDLSFKKQVPISGSKRLELQYDLLNVFKAINFTPVFQASADPTINQVTEAATDPSQVFDPGGRLGQVVVRFVW
jgi:hypothetical protein